jgi:hypothetical protein
MNLHQKKAELLRIEELLGGGQHDIVLVPVSLGKKSPFRKGWNSVTPEEAKDEKYQELLVHYGNTGVLLGAECGRLVGIDADSEEEAQAWMKANPRLEDTYTRTGKKGCVFIVRITDEIPGSRNFSGRGEWKANGTQVVVRGMHPSGVPYRDNDKPPLSMSMAELVFPDGWSLERIRSKGVSGTQRGEGRGNTSSEPCNLHPRFYASSLYDTEKVIEGSRITLSKQFAEQYGKQAENLYQGWMLPYEDDLRQGQRNSILTHSLVPKLFDKCGTEMTLRLTAQFWLRNRALFHDSLQEHQHQALHVINALKNRYPDELTPTELETYEELNDDYYRDIFRIVRSLGLYDDGTTRPPMFFLSGDSLSARLGIPVANRKEAQRILVTMRTFGIIRRMSKGSAHRTGMRGKAADYCYLLEGAVPEDPVPTPAPSEPEAAHGQASTSVGRAGAACLKPP